MYIAPAEYVIPDEETEQGLFHKQMRVAKWAVLFTVVYMILAFFFHNGSFWVLLWVLFLSDGFIGDRILGPQIRQLKPPAAALERKATSPYALPLFGFAVFAYITLLAYSMWMVTHRIMVGLFAALFAALCLLSAGFPLYRGLTGRRSQ
jgi:hypothetical protein